MGPFIVFLCFSKVQSCTCILMDQVNRVGGSGMMIVLQALKAELEADILGKSSEPNNLFVGLKI